MAELLVPGYSDANRAFLQALLARTTLTWETARPLIAKIESVHEGTNVSAEDISQDDLDTYVKQANRALLPLDMEIRSTLHQLSRERIYALVNMTSDPIMQLATTYTADEIAFVKKMLDAMFDGSNNRGKNELMCLSSIQLVQLARDVRRQTNGEEIQATQIRMTGQEAEDLGSRLEQEGWLEKSDAGFYTLSARALMELKTWLIDAYNEPADDGVEEDVRAQKIKFCHACKEIITVVSQTKFSAGHANTTQGQRCPKRECPCRLHDICTQNFFRSQRSRTCPICKADWDGKSYVGERVLTLADGPGRSGRPRGSAGAGRSTQPVQDEEMQENEQEYEE